MSKIVLPSIGSGYASVQKLNEALQQIADELENNVLYRNNPIGSPNELNNSIDFNLNDALNVRNLDVQYMTLAGKKVVSDITTIEPAAPSVLGVVTLATDEQVRSGTPVVVPDSKQVRREHVGQVATIDALRALEPAFDGQQASLGEDNAAGVFRHDSSSAAADDGVDVLVTGGGKRWVRAVGKLSHSLSLDTGADLVGWKGSTVGERLDNLEFSSSFVPAIIPNNKDAANRDIIIMGDSISHGAFALNTFKHGWARIFQRMINAEVGSQSYGFTNLLSLGSGPTLTEDIHQVSFSGSWSGVAADSVQAAVSLAGFAIRSPGVGSGITIYLPLFQVRGGICYIQQPGGGTFTITVNGVLAATVDTDGSLSQQEALFNFSDNGYGSVQIVISHTVAGTVDIVGPAYYSGVIEPTVHNFSTSGCRLRNTGEAAIVSAMQRASTFVLALGHNDYFDCANNGTYLAEFTQRIDWIIQYANQYNVKVIVPDFCWSAVVDNPARVQLRRAAAETGGRYVDLPGMIASNGVLPTGSYLIDTLKMWTDGSHPNKSGMQWIAETIARSISLSCCSKKDALDFHDYWMPVPLKSATGVENAIALYPSMYRKNGCSIVFYFYIEADPGVAFPIGSYSLSDGFNTKSELSTLTGIAQIATINHTNGDVVSFVSVAGTGAVTLNVLAAYINDIYFTVTIPA